MKNKLFITVVTALMFTIGSVKASDEWTVYDADEYKNVYSCSTVSWMGHIIMGVRMGQCSYIYYDGHEMTTINMLDSLISEHNIPNMPWVRSMCFDLNNNIVAASNEGLIVSEGLKYRLFTNAENSGMSNKTIGVTIDQHNNKWLLSNSPNITKYDGENFENFEYDYKNINFNMMHVDMHVDGGDTLWLLASNGLLQFHDGVQTFHKIEDITDYSTNFRSMIVSPLNSIIVVGYNADQTQYTELLEYKGGKWGKLSGYEELIDIKDEILFIAMDRDYNTWFTIKNKFKMLKMDKYGKWDSVSIPNVFEKDYFEPGALSFDNANNMIVSVDYQGVMVNKPTIHVDEIDFALLPNLYIRSVNPNPMVNISTVEMLVFPGYENDIKISLCTYIGQVVWKGEGLEEYNRTTGEGRFLLDIPNVPNGYYLLCVQSKGENRALPIIISR